MFRKFFHWLLDSHRKAVIARAEDEARRQAETRAPIPAKAQAPVLRPTFRSGLTHKRIYVFGIAQSGQSCTSCKVCGRANQHVFSDCEDDSGNGFRCCLYCLRQYGGESQVQRAARSKYARRAIECMDALDQLRAEFPNPERRPFGEISLLAEIALPLSGYEGIQRIITKIHERKWTEYDLAKIEGRPLPPPRSQD